MIIWRELVELGIRNDCRGVSYDTIKNKQYVVDASLFDFLILS